MCNLNGHWLSASLLLAACALGCHESPRSLGDVLSAEIIDVATGVADGGKSNVVSIVASQLNQSDLNKLRDAAVEVFPTGEWVNFGPNSSFRSIRLRCRNGVIDLASWHPLAEERPGVVAASYGLTSLNGRSRNEFLSDDEPSYIRRRKAFDALQEQLLSLDDKDSD